MGSKNCINSNVVIVHRCKRWQIEHCMIMITLNWHIAINSIDTTRPSRNDVKIVIYLVMVK